MKFFSFLRFDILQLVLHCKSPLKYSTQCSTNASTQAVKEAKSNQKLLNCKRWKNSDIYAPVLKKEKLQELNSICGITVAFNHVSWAKILIHNLTLLDWDAYLLPLDFINSKHGSNNSLLANNIKQNIPSADLYVTENQIKWASSLNEIHLKAMLVLLLSFDKDVPVQDKVIFQKVSVLNYTHKLLIGGERKSVIPVVTNLLKVVKTKKEAAFVCDQIPVWYSELEVPEELKVDFIRYSLERKESLSLALLLTLSFLNENLFILSGKLRCNKNLKLF